MFKVLFPWLVVLSIGVFSIPQALAQMNPVVEQMLSKRLGTTTTEANPVFSDGALTGCSVVFGALIRDFTYKAGNYVRVDGSFSLMIANRNFAINVEGDSARLRPQVAKSDRQSAGQRVLCVGELDKSRVLNQPIFRNGHAGRYHYDL
jgi:hypothetical protein